MRAFLWSFHRKERLVVYTFSLKIKCRVMEGRVVTTLNSYIELCHSFMSSFEIYPYACIMVDVSSKLALTRLFTVYASTFRLIVYKPFVNFVNKT